MSTHKSIYAILLIVSGIFFSGCLVNSNPEAINSSSEFITVSGVAEETKDGYYLDGYVLTHEEIQTYDANYVWGEYRGQNIEVVGTTKAVSVDCEPYTQCREGSFNVLYDILSITVIE